MLPPMKTGWPIGRKAGGRLSRPGPKARVAPLRWTNSSRRLPSIHVQFHLAGVVRNVEQQRKLAAGKEMPEDTRRIVAEDLAVGEGAVDRRPHRAEIAPSDLRLDRRAGEFAIGQRDSDACAATTMSAGTRCRSDARGRASRNEWRRRCRSCLRPNAAAAGGSRISVTICTSR